jgi:predicted nucleotidyltransferase
LVKKVKVQRKPFRRRRGLVPRAAIRRLADDIAERFHPEKIILFGSYAYGEPSPDSDVDLLVVMPAADETNQAVRIRTAVRASFPMDLIVRTPFRLHQRLNWGDTFLREIVSQGNVLHEKTDRRMGQESRRRLKDSSHARRKNFRIA